VGWILRLLSAAAAGNGKKKLTAADTVTATCPIAKGRPSMYVAILVIAALVIVIGGGYLIVFRMMKGSQTVVPHLADERAAGADRVVAVNEKGQPVTEAEDVSPEPPRDEAGFERVLEESLDELHPERRG
jgi:hypothetical protein